MSAYPLKSNVTDQLLSATQYKGASLGGVPKGNIILNLFTIRDTGRNFGNF